MQDSLFDFPQMEINKPIRLITLFSGIGSQEMALRDIGADFEIWKVVEFDKYAMKAYNAIHGTNFKTTDIRDVHGVDLGIKMRDKFTYLLTYSFPCFTGDMLILTKDGLKQIKDISTDDYVLTHKNDYQKVIASRKTGEKQIYKIKGMAIDELRCTENHRFYVRKMTRHYPTENGRRKRIRTFEKPEWIECKNLNKNYYLGIAINKNSIIPEWRGIDFTWTDGRKTRHKNELSKLMNNHSFWWIIGRYLGDGWTRQLGGIIICCAKDETIEILPHLRNCNFNYSIAEERTVIKIHIALKELQMFVEQFGKGAKNKKLPGFIFDMPCDLLQSLFEGYISADGYVHNGLFKVSSISRELIYGFAQVVAKVYKTPYRIYKDKRNPIVIIEGRKCHQQDGFVLVFKTEKKKQDKAFYENGFIWFPIQSIENTKQIEEVYDIETESAHSFTANGVIVHNCTDLSVAGKMQGMSKSEWENGNSTRSGLLWEVERILKELPEDELPQVLLMENVPQVHAEQNRADFEAWLSFLRSKGYHNFWDDLNARDYGIPQSRDRCFCVSILSDEFVDYEFPSPIPLTTVMKDYLEETVDERFYINTGKAKILIQNLLTNNQEKQICVQINYNNVGKIGCKVAKALDTKCKEFNTVFQLKNGVVETIDLSLKNPKKIKIANCIGAREDRSISSLSKVGNGVLERIEETKCIGGLTDKKWGNKQYHQRDRVYQGDIALAIPANIPGGSYKYIVAMRGRNPERPTDRTPGLPTEQRLEKAPEGMVNTITTVQKDNLVLEQNGTAGSENINYAKTQYRIRKLTPKECWRLMGYTDKDFEKAASVESNTQLYKQAGNAIVKQVLMAIFSQMNIKGVKPWNDMTLEEKYNLIRKSTSEKKSKNN